MDLEQLDDADVGCVDLLDEDGAVGDEVGEVGEGPVCDAADKVEGESVGAQDAELLHVIAEIGEERGLGAQEPGTLAGEGEMVEVGCDVHEVPEEGEGFLGVEDVHVAGELEDVAREGPFDALEAVEGWDGRVWEGEALDAGAVVAFGGHGFDHGLDGGTASQDGHVKVDAGRGERDATDVAGVGLPLEPLDALETVEETVRSDLATGDDDVLVEERQSEGSPPLGHQNDGGLGAQGTRTRRRCGHGARLVKGNVLGRDGLPSGNSEDERPNFCRKSGREARRA